jgi:hypoxanthine phosphoribosyltransferase
LDNLKPLIAKEQIATSIAQAASEIDSEYANRDLVIVMVLKGAICFTADLIRSMTITCDLQTVQCSSYGAGGTKRGELTIFGLEALEIENRDLLVVDDIFDSGYTLFTLSEALKKKNPSTIKSLVLLTRNAPHVPNFRPDRSLFTIKDEFVIGYGLDYKEKYRGLPAIYALEAE